MALTLSEARKKGARSRLTNVDWDEALVRFGNKYCQPHNPNIMCEIEHAWCDGWDDAL